MKVTEIIKEWLVKNGCSGICNIELDCGCDMDDLYCCGDVLTDCEPCWKIPADCDNCEIESCEIKGETKWCRTTIRPNNQGAKK